jgi:hypothetical protein
MTRSRSGSNVSMTTSSVRSSSTSTSASASACSTLGGFDAFLHGGSSSLSEYSIPTNVDAAEVSRNFHKMLDELRSIGPARDPSSVRRAACCSALVETAQEEQRRRRRRRRGGIEDGNDNNDGDESISDDDVAVTPNEVFVAAIAALTSLQSSLEARNKSLSSSSSSTNITTTVNDKDAVIESMSLEIQNTALPLLEILRRTLPYVAHRDNNSGMLLLHQFGTLSRMLRMFVALGYSVAAAISSSTANAVGDGGGRVREQKRKRKHHHHHSSSSSSSASMQGGAAVAGANALLRQILKVSTTLLLVTPPPAWSSPVSNNNTNVVSEKDLARLLHNTIVPMFHDVRPKVRKAALACGMEIIVVASVVSTVEKDDDDDDDDNHEIVPKVKQQRRVVADFLWEYCHAIIENYAPTGSKDTMMSSKIIHVLRFLSGALQYADDERIRVRFGECCLAMLTGGGGSVDSGGKSASLPPEIVKEVLTTLLSCFEATEHEQESRDDDKLMGRKEKSTKDQDENMAKFAAKSLTFLLQHRPNSSNNSSFYDWKDMNVMYGRCMLACMDRMLNISSNDSSSDEGGCDTVPAPKLLAMKLLPSVLTSMLHLCEATGSSASAEREGESGSHHSETCGSEFNQLISRMMPIIVRFLDRQRTNPTLHRVSLEALPQCVPIVQQALQLKYRSAWGSILSGGYSTFTSTISRTLLDTRSSTSSTDDVGGKEISELEDKLSSWVQTLVLSLLRLHDDVAMGDAAARTAVEYATSNLIREIGVELFFSAVDFLDEDGDHGGSKSKSLSKSSTGGGIRDNRAWLLPLMKQSSDGSRRSTTVEDCMTLKTHLSFFQGNVLNLARKCDAASADGHRTAAEISIQKARVVELWSLFPSFCVYPVDMKVNFENIAKTVLKAIGDYVRYPALIVSDLILCLSSL